MTSNAPNNAPSGPAAEGVINAPPTGGPPTPLGVPAVGVNNAPSTGEPQAPSVVAATGVINAPPTGGPPTPLGVPAVGVNNAPSTGGPQAPSVVAATGVINAPPTGGPQAPSVVAATGVINAPATGGPQGVLQPILLSFSNGNVAKPINKKKRKNAASALNIMRRKRIRPTLIDDRIVIGFFRELRMTRQFIHSGALLAWSLQPTDPDFLNIHDYIERGQEHGYGVKVISIIRVIAAAPNLASDNQVVDFNDNPQTKGQRRMMLWHGTKRRCLANILRSGLQMPTYTGQMFGPGIYFADRVSKSCNYCDRNGDGDFLLLCDVLLGTSYETFTAIPRLRNAPQAPGGVPTQSVLGMGKRIPDASWNMTIDGTIWPMGKTVDRNSAQAYLQFNEYVVYDTAQVVPKYLVKFQFTQAPISQVLY